MKRRSFIRNHVHDWGKFRALDSARRGLVLEAAVMAGVVGIGLRTMSLAQLRRVLNAYSRILRSRSRPPLENVGWAVRAATRRAAAPHTCLLEALIAEFMLRRRHYEPAFRVGVRRTPDEQEPIDGHAWVECNGAVIVGVVSHLAEYAPLAPQGCQ